ncbi:MAG: hypothetical protein PXY39_00300 [archaeon]|nr:hypothetical protein [archaeon]
MSEAKTLGGVGSILVLFTAVPYVGVVLGIAGFVMVLIAVKYISDVIGIEQVFRNMIISVLLAVGAIF